MGGGGGGGDNSAAIAAAKKMELETARMRRESEYRNAYSEARRRALEKQASLAQPQMNAPLQMIQPPQPMQQPEPTQPLQIPQSQSAQVRSVSNSTQFPYGSTQQAKIAALGVGAGSLTTNQANAARQAMTTPQLNSFNAPEINNLKFGGA